MLRTDRTWIVAEIGVNHEGSEEAAATMIRAAARTGADAVKFQTYRPETYVSTAQPERRARVGRFCLSYAATARLASLAVAEGLAFFSTPLHPDDADALDPFVPGFKISSGDLPWHGLLRHIASKRKPMIVSTGAATVHEIDAALAAIEEAWPTIRAERRLTLMHCVAAYPAPPEQANLAAIRFLSERYGVPVGFSDHTQGMEAAPLAVAAGAVAIEKHFTDTREGRTFHDHHLSLNPDEMADLVGRVRAVEAMLGGGLHPRQACELPLLLHLRRSVGVAQDLAAGTVLGAEMLVALRPAWGVPIEAIGAVIGKRLKGPLAAGDLVMAANLE